MSSVKSITPIQTAIKEMLIAAPSFNVKDSSITMNQIVNGDISLMPWVGVYPSKIPHDLLPHALGTKKWKDTVKIDIMVQAASLLNYGTEAVEILETLIAECCDIFIADTSLKKTVTRLYSITVEYTYVEDGNGGYIPAAVITLTMETRT